MSCNQHGFSINNDNANKTLEKLVLRVAGSDTQKAIILAGYINSNEFLGFVKSSPNVSDAVEKLLDVNLNTLEQLLNSYFISKHPGSIMHTVMHGDGSELSGFNTASAKSLAKSYVNSLLNDAYYQEFTKPKGTRLSKPDIIKKVIKEINVYFNKSVSAPFLKRLAELNNPNANKDIAKIKELSDSVRDNNGNIRKDVTEKQVQDVIRQINVIKINLINTYGSVREKNFANLINVIKQNPNQWFSEAISRNKLMNITREFEDIVNDESIYDGAFLDDTDSISLEDDSINKMSESWSESMPSSFDKLIADDLKIYLNRIYKLNTTRTYVDERTGKVIYDYMTNNELGVPETYGSNFLTVQLSNLSFYSLDDFISSIERAANEKPGLEGLIQIANDCKKNRKFANYVFHQLNNPKIQKLQLELFEGSIKVDQSNKGIDGITSMIYDMINSIKGTYKTMYDPNDIVTINKELKSLSSKVSTLSTDKRDKLNRLIEEILTKYYPKVDVNGIRGYLYSSDTNIKERYKNLLETALSAIKASEVVIDSVNEELTRVNKANKELKNDRIAAEFANGISGVATVSAKKETFNYDNINFSAFNAPTIKLANYIADYSSISVELNSTNAEGNLSSDLINNSYITNLLRQIQFGTDEDAELGLRNLKDFITQGHQYDYSPLFFGIRNDKGGLIRPGIFNRDPITGVVTINKNAKRILNVGLFDGIKELSTLKGSMYKSMSKGDYFLTFLYGYMNPIKYPSLINVQDEDLKNEFAGYFMRTPSDSPKNFVIQTYKSKLDNLFTPNLADAQNYITDVITNIKNKYNIKTSNSAYKESDSIRDGRINKYAKNIITAQELFDILMNTPESMGYNTRYPIVDKTTNKVLIPLIYSSDSGRFIVWLEGDKVEGITDKFIENVTIKEIYTKDADIVNEIVNEYRQDLIEEGILNGEVALSSAKNNPLFRGFYQQLLGELNNFINNLNNVFIVKNGKATLKKDTKDLFDRAHYKGTIVKDGQLSGNFFQFIKLFNINDYNVDETIKRTLSLYGGGNALLTPTKNGRLKLNTSNELISIEDDVIQLNITDKVKDVLNTIVSDWLIAYRNDIILRSKSYATVLETTNYKTNDVVEAMINNALTEMSFDELFEGDVKFYKDAQDFVKRAKEAQAGGKAYAGYDFADKLGIGIYDKTTDPITINGRQINLPRRGTTGIVEAPLYARNGFRAVTIENTIKPSEYAPKIKQELLDNGTSEQIATEIAKGYYETTTTNDAQSYITLEEFITRKYLDGTLSQYEDLLEQIYDVRDGKKELKDIDLQGINARIQVQKNFYYDIQYDPTTGCYYPRQIKNAEFVLIPELLKGTDLEQLYHIMRKNDIGQVNTTETSKAAKRNILKFWDNNGKANAEEFEKQINTGIKTTYSDTVIENYYYRYLYKQQDVPQHLIDAKNKAGIQVLKKLIDNASPELAKTIESFFDNYCANIKDSFNTLLDNMGWKIDAKGNLVNKDNKSETLNFTEFWKKARVEAQRLGMDSNFIEYLTPDYLGNPIMPNWFNNVSSKLENIAQSIFNSTITRQTLPGWHAAQITSVGHGAKVLDSDGQWRTLKYHPEADQPYMEVLLPRWDSRIPKTEEALKQLAEEGLDIHLGYRIPTEGKQSVSIMKVVGFLDDVYGSTIMVPDEWVTQTGSDFDVDSVYGISYKTYIDKKGNLKKINLDLKTDEESVQRRYINYINSRIKQLREEKIKQNPIEDNIVKETYNELYDELLDASKFKENNDKFVELTKESEALWKQIPNNVRKSIIEFNKQLAGNEFIVERYENIINISTDAASTEKDLKKKEDLLEFADINSLLLDIIEYVDDNYKDFIREFKSEKSAKYKELVKANKQHHFNRIKYAAGRLGLPSYNTFKSWTPIEQNSRDARNNAILDAFIKIMEHPSSREENYSRSNFDILSDAKEIGDNLRGANSISRSAYNPLDQIDFMENAISGRDLKAMSVNRDTFASICNRVKPRLSSDHRIIVAYDANKYDVESIKKSYSYTKGDISKVYQDGDKVYVVHDRLGWSEDNRNVTGHLITPYTSQTTAHILDAIKKGAIFNENKYTFGAFKTLVDVGVDYETAVPFLMQPAVTELVNVYHETNSVYIGGKVNIPKTALNRIAASYGIKVNGKLVDDYPSTGEVLKAITNSKDFVDAFNQLFSAKLDVSKDITEQQFIIDGTLLKNRLNSSGIFNNPIFRFAFDVGTLLTFNKLVNTSRYIDKLVNCAKPDKFGAKQTVFSTRQIIDDIDVIINNPNNPISQMLTVDGKNFLSTLYPGFGTKDGIDVSKSSYPYLAAFLKYATLPSVAINSQLFFTESDKFDNIINETQLKFGRNFTEKEYKEFKQYIITYLYNNIEFLRTPQTINSQHNFIPDIDEMLSEEERLAIYRKEYARINGYETLESSNLKVQDINNPTEEEIKRFNKLTPLQKVVWMQQNFTIYNGIFGHLKTNFFNQKELKDKGISHQTIRFNDQLSDIEDLFVAFNYSFFNTNPLVRLATLDLIKYAFIVEGFRFKKGGISKLITNKALYLPLNERGTNIVEFANNLMKEVINPRYYVGLIHNFVRSHPEIIKLVRIPKKSKSNIAIKLTRTAINNNANQIDKVYAIRFTEENKELLNHLGLTEYDSRSYIRLTIGNKTVLYKVNINQVGVFLYPLNLLEKNETINYSYNSANNTYYTEDFYEKLYKSYYNYDEEGFKTYINNEVNSTYLKQFILPEITIKYTRDIEGNIDKLEELRTSGSELEKGAVNKFIVDALKVVNSPVEGGNKFIHNSEVIAKLFTNNTPIVQRIAIDNESSKLLCFTKINLSSRIYNQIVSGTFDETKVPKAEVIIAKKYKELGIRDSKIYKVEEVYDQDIIDEMASAIDPIDEIDEAFEYTSNPVYLSAKDVLSQLHIRNRDIEDTAAADAIDVLESRYVDPNSAKSIWDNKKNIYGTAAEYYTRKANELLSNINEFTTSTGEIYSINDEKLYTEYLPNHPEDYHKLVKIILDAKTFGKGLYEIFNLDLVGEDAETSKYIKQIRKAINSVRDNEKINGKYGAVNRLFNDYIAKEYSTNPLIKEGLVNLKDTFGDTDWFDLNFSAVNELNHKQIQTVVKYAMGIINAATQLVAPQAVNDFLKAYDSIAGDNFKFDRIITPDGKLIAAYNDQFLKDREKVIDDVKIEAAKGIDRKEYYEAVLKRDKWFARYTNQPIVDEYYYSKNRAIETVLKFAPELYIEYKKLTRELYKNDLLNSKDPEDRAYRNRLLKQIKQLHSQLKEDGTPKDEEQMRKAKVLGNYLEEMKRINNQYFKYDEKQGFRESLEYYSKIIKNYEIEHPYETLDVRLQNEDYAEAYDWIQSNAIYRLSEEANTKINAAFKVFKSDDHITSETVRASVPETAYDSYGNIDARLIPEETIAKIKSRTEEKYTLRYDTSFSDNMLIKEIPANLPVLNDEFYRGIRDEETTAKIPNEKRLEIIKKINDYLRPYRIPYTGQLDTVALIKGLTDEERADLVSLYTQIRHLKKSKKEIYSIKKFAKKVVFKTYDVAFNREYVKAESELKGTPYFKDWLSIFVEHDKQDNILFTDDGDYIPARNVFGYYEPKDDTFIDKEKTEARQLLNDNVRFVPNEYYYNALATATKEGRFKEWYDANHVYNPYKGRMEPLKIWTKMEVVPNGGLDVSYTYLPTYDNTHKNVLDDYKNPEYKKYSVNYKQLDKEVKENTKVIDYDNPVYNSLTKQEQKMVELLQGTINQYTVNNIYASESMKSFATRDYLPRRLKQNIDTEWYLKQGLGIFGWTAGRTGENAWTNSIDYTDGQVIDFPMMQLLKDKNYKEYIKAEAQGSRTDDEYRKYLESVKKQNKKIREHNEAIDKELFDSDWRNVFQDFINNAIEYNAKNKVKNTIYLTLEDLKDTKAYELSSFNNNLMTDYKRTTNDRIEYKKIDQENSVAIFENWARRVLFKQHRKNSPFNNVADLLQNVTSAKYMMFNVPGGIANVGTGLTNIFNEVFAKDFFDAETFAKAQAQYFKNGLNMLTDMYNDRTDNLTVALIKMFDVVDFDAIIEKRSNKSASERLRHYRDFLYSIQSGGEHYMQNTVLLAMLKSHRIVKNGKKYSVMSFNDYTMMKEIETLKAIVSKDTDLKKLYDTYIRNVKKDLNKIKQFDTFTEDVNRNFLRAYCSKEIIDDYIKQRDVVLKEAKNEFKLNPTLESQYILKDGIAVLADNALISEEDTGRFKEKVQSVNQKIHGVYDKIGAARIQKEWWGGLLMQYHKHIYPGIMKRFRRKGYYNEIRGNIEQGSYITLANLLSTEFVDIKNRIDARRENGENIALASIREVVKASIDTIINYKMNYDLMTEWEQHNLHRVLGDLLGIAMSFMLAICIHLMADDDDLDDNNFLATGLYIADRLNSEAQMYMPWGLYSEASTLWSSPIASANGPLDLLKGLSVGIDWLFNDDFNIKYTTGLYKGQNKLAVLLYRNIPIVRGYNRIMHMKDNNNYYRINENSINIKYSSNIADVIKDAIE